MIVKQTPQENKDNDENAAVNVTPGALFPHVVLLCEHGGNLVPPEWSDLGIPRSFFDTHFGFDIRAAEVTNRVAKRLGATAIVSNYSRLFLDYNRYSSDLDFFRLDMGGIPIPGNWDLSSEEIELRETLARRPVELVVDNWTSTQPGEPLMLISIHSFSPIWANKIRNCEIGVMWREDNRLAPKLIEALRKEGGLKVEENKPYDFRKNNWFTLKRHGLDADVPCAYIEINNRFVIDKTGMEKVSGMLSRAISSCVLEST